MRRYFNGYGKHEQNDEAGTKDAGSNGQASGRVEERVVEASAGGEAVTVKVNGKQEVLEIKINPDVVDPDDVEMLEDLVLAAVNEA